MTVFIIGLGLGVCVGYVLRSVERRMTYQRYAAILRAHAASMQNALDAIERRNRGTH